jgi:hypothetical protein
MLSPDFPGGFISLSHWRFAAFHGTLIFAG